MYNRGLVFCFIFGWPAVEIHENCFILSRTSSVRLLFVSFYGCNVLHKNKSVKLVKYLAFDFIRGENSVFQLQYI